jgi:hypothetical protein
MTPYLVLADLLATHVDTEVLTEFKASDEVRTHFYALFEKEKTGVAATEEIAEIDQFIQEERILQIAKARVAIGIQIWLS